MSKHTQDCEKEMGIILWTQHLENITYFYIKLLTPQPPWQRHVESRQDKRCVHSLAVVVAQYRKTASMPRAPHDHPHSQSGPCLMETNGPLWASSTDIKKGNIIIYIYKARVAKASTSIVHTQYILYYHIHAT